MRSADKTKAGILDAARRILTRDGFAGLGVNALAAEAGVGKPLIYRYFGDLAGVAAALVGEIAPRGLEPVKSGPDATEAAEAVKALIGYGRGLAGDRTRRDLMAWSLAAPGAPPLDADGKETPEPISGTSLESDPAGVMAIMQAAITFLLICSDRHDAWAGLPLNEPRHMARLERAMAAIVRATLTEPQVTNR